jgi:hypothetical protein
MKGVVLAGGLGHGCPRFNRADDLFSNSGVDRCGHLSSRRSITERSKE